MISRKRDKWPSLVSLSPYLTLNKKGKGTPYLTSEVPLLSREYSPQEADGALILLPSFPSVLRFKGI